MDSILLIDDDVQLCGQLTKFFSSQGLDIEAVICSEAGVLVRPCEV
jgi:DNA-binding response OmpR family regulator